MNDEPLKFPVGRAFLDLTQKLADDSSKATDGFFGEAGKSLPETIEIAGTMISIFYRPQWLGYRDDRADRPWEPVAHSTGGGDLSGALPWPQTRSHRL